MSTKEVTLKLSYSNLYIFTLITFNLRQFSKKTSQFGGVVFFCDFLEGFGCGALEHLMVEEGPEELC